MTSIDPEAEDLHAALEAMARGPGGCPPSNLPGDLARLVGVAGRLADHGRLSTGAPRPSFVLALEEQLRCDLRLGPTGAPPAARGGVVWALVLAIGLSVLALLALGSAVERAEPGDTLRDWQPALNALQLAAVSSPEGKAEVLLAQGWRHAALLRHLASADGLSTVDLTRLLADLGRSYEGALRYAADSGDERLLRRVLREGEDVVAILETVARESSPEFGQPVAAAREALQVRLLSFVPGVVGLAPATPTPTRPALWAGATATLEPTAAPGGYTLTPLASPSPGSSTPVPTNGLPATATAPPPAASATRDPSSTPTPEPSVTAYPPAPPARERTPSPSPPPPSATAVMSPVPDTPTPDAWPTRTPAVEPTTEPTSGPDPGSPTAERP